VVDTTAASPVAGAMMAAEKGAVVAADSESAVKDLALVVARCSISSAMTLHLTQHQQFLRTQACLEVHLEYAEPRLV